MHKKKNILLNTAISLFAAVLSSGCMMEKEDMSAERQSVMIELNVSVGDLTKSTPTSSEKNINTLRVYAFCGSRLAGTTFRNNTALNEPFYMDLELPASGVHDVDFYLIANESEMADENVSMVLSENMSRTEIESIRYNGLMTRNALPMYCKQTESINVDSVLPGTDNEDGHEGHFVLTQKVSFELTRSLAKLSIYAAKVEGSSSNPQILSARILAKGTRMLSYLFPQTDNVLDEVVSRTEDRILFNSPKTVTSAISKGSSQADDPSNYDLIRADDYLPEVPYGSYAFTSWNTSSGFDREVVLYIEYNLGEGQAVKHAYVYLPEIVRNTHYKVCILINAEGQIIINYVVADWEDHLMPNLSFDYPTHSYVRATLPEAGTDQSAQPDAPARMSESTGFTGYFQMTYPSNDAWTPTLIGLNASSCTLRVYEVPGSVEVTQWPIPASDKWYRIEVSPNAGHMSVGDEVQLAISYQASGLETKEFLLINGTQGLYYWPYDGTSIQDDQYVIITMVN